MKVKNCKVDHDWVFEMEYSKKNVTPSSTLLEKENKSMKNRDIRSRRFGIDGELRPQDMIKKLVKSLKHK